MGWPMVGVVLTVLYGVWFRLTWYWIVFLVLVTLGSMLYVTCMQRREAHKREDFYRVTEYMQGMGMSFLVTGSEYPALKDAIMLFPKGRFKSCLQQVLQHMEQSRDGRGSERGFYFMEKQYPCKKLKLLHSYILTATKVGGEFENGIRLLLRDQELWKRRQILAYEDLRQDKRKITVALGLTVLLCGYVSYLSGNKVDLTGYFLYQLGSVFLWCGCIGIYLLGQRSARMDWFEEKHRYSEEEVKRMMERFMTENGRRSLGHKTRRDILKQEFLQAFPEWLLDVALRMEHKNVEVALEESYHQAHVIIRPYLTRLLARLKKNPQDAEAYFCFGADFQVPEVANSMKLLYGLSTGRIAGGKQQLMDVIERNYQMDHLHKDYQLEKKKSLMYGLTVVPGLLGALQLIINMSLLLVGFMGHLKI